LLRSGRFGEFIACSGFPKCKYTEQTEENKKEIATNAEGEITEVCEKCGSPMVTKNGRNGPFIACSAYPECKNTKTLHQETKYSETPCPDCGGKLLWRQSFRGAFWGCESYPKCKFISKFEPCEKKCEIVGCGGALAPRTFRNKEIYECTKCKDKTPREEP
jgi:DNA topoisomerase-1